VLRTSEIEGEILDRAVVRSSLARRLGVPDAGAALVDRRTEGTVAMLLDAVGRYEAPLTADRLFGWQAALFPTGYSGLHQVAVGRWRDDAEGPMQVVSGPTGRQWVHYEAPPAAVVDAEMERFPDWFNAAPGVEGLLRAGLAHLWFVTVHPLGTAMGGLPGPSPLWRWRSQRVPVSSSTVCPVRSGWSGRRSIRRWNRRRKGQWTLRIGWSGFGLSVAGDRRGAHAMRASVLRKAVFWERFGAFPMSARQRMVLNRFLDDSRGS
jgi:Domain of unknown function (DUF4172)/Fic/DOC family